MPGSGEDGRTMPQRHEDTKDRRWTAARSDCTRDSSCLRVFVALSSSIRAAAPRVRGRRKDDATKARRHQGSAVDRRTLGLHPRPFVPSCLRGSLVLYSRGCPPRPGKKEGRCHKDTKTPRIGGGPPHARNAPETLRAFVSSWPSRPLFARLPLGSGEDGTTMPQRHEDTKHQRYITARPDCTRDPSCLRVFVAFLVFPSFRPSCRRNVRLSPPPASRGIIASEFAGPAPLVRGARTDKKRIHA